MKTCERLSIILDLISISVYSKEIGSWKDVIKERSIPNRSKNTAAKFDNLFHIIILYTLRAVRFD